MSDYPSAASPRQRKKRRSRASSRADLARLAAFEDENRALRERLHDAERELGRLREACAPDERLARQLAQSEARCARLERALAQLQEQMEPLALPAQHPPCLEAREAGGVDLSGRRLLYVGGRTGLVERYRSLVERHGGELLHHDGGLERASIACSRSSPPPIWSSARRAKRVTRRTPS